MKLLTFLARRFIAGESVDDAIKAVKQLNGTGMSATLDILGENVSSQEMAIRTADKYIAVLQSIKDTGIDSNISIKLTQMGMDISDQFCYDNFCGSNFADAAGGASGRWAELYRCDVYFDQCNMCDRAGGAGYGR